MQISNAALELFAYGQQEASKRGLLLVDTKYEFGKDSHGTIRLIDEIHTPDSSRCPYEARFEPGEVAQRAVSAWNMI